jgi:outer membrane protein assembly factor BamB
VTDGERVYAWFGTGQLVALDMNGKLVWERHLGKEYAPVSIIWGPGSSPAVYKDSVILLNYLGQTSFLLSVDAKTGKTKWKSDRQPGVTSYSTPIVVPGPNGPELVVNASDGVAGFNPDTGERLWYYNEANNFPIPAPVFENGVIYLNRGYRSSPYMALRPGGKGDIASTHVVWRQATSGPYVPSIVQYQGLIYMATDQGIVSAVDAATGERVWRERIPGVYMASPVAGDGKIYLAGETGETLVLEAGRQLKILARNKLSGRFTASPAIAEGRIFLRSDDRVIAVGP